jgi:hypothetical protein
VFASGNFNSYTKIGHFVVKIKIIAVFATKPYQKTLKINKFALEMRANIEYNYFIILFR